MKNTTNIKVPKKYEVAIQEIYHDQDGYWVVLNRGYYAAGLGGFDECHTIHEDLQSDVLKQIRQIKRS